MEIIILVGLIIWFFSLVIMEHQNHNKDLKMCRGIMKAKIQKIERFEDIDSLDFYFNYELQSDLYQEALKKVCTKKFLNDKKIREAEDRILEEFEKSIKCAEKLNPEIRKSIDYAGQFAHYIPAETRYALLTDEYGPEVINEIAKTPGMLESFIEMDPIEVTKTIKNILDKHKKFQSIGGK